MGKEQVNEWKAEAREEEECIYLVLTIITITH